MRWGKVRMNLRSLFHFKSYNLRAKLILLYLFAIMLPLLLIAQVLLKVSENQIIRQTTELTKESSRQSANNVQDLLKQYADLATHYSFDRQLQEYLNPAMDYSDYIDSIEAYQYYLKPITYNFTLDAATAKLSIYFLNDTLLPGLGIYRKVDDVVELFHPYRRAVEAGREVVWGKEADEIYVSRTIRNASGDLYGVIELKFPEDRLYALIRESDPKEKTIALADVNGSIISSNDRQLIGKKVPDEFASAGGASGKPIVGESPGQFKTIAVPIDGKNMPAWTLITQVPIDSLLTEARYVRNVGLIVLGSTLLVSFLLFTLLLGRITSRVRQLVSTMGKVKQGLFIRAPERDSGDEISQLTRSFNLMVAGLERSIEDNYVTGLSLKDAELKKREAELYALQSQINPHFLFNTLESIRMKLIASDDPREASDMVLNLSKILRKSLNWHGNIVSVREEIELVRCYLDIQKYRFRNKISDELDIPEELAEMSIPKLIIQPIVENAIKHGIENKKGSGSIALRIRRQGDRVRIAVEDDGVGIDEQRLSSIRASLTMKDAIRVEGRSIGLRNVHERIVLQYGKDYGLSIESAVNLGTTVVLEIPADAERASGKEEPHV
ncbi:two-component system sensor histidine kinase YesM [Cohnella phaseoli]|uniref:histidine kinase n=2 Tax=Cohnella phaseoli TaxID=456490 RepID=A0A3D9KNI3_9BACL|nr:two-component system sensor histidine kinase YesM [Cohnella phaseoli]